MAEQMKQPGQHEIEASFRSSLEEVLVVVERLTPFCNSLEELTGLLRLGLENDAQLRLILGRIKPR